MTTVISYAPEAWSVLNGVFCIYKPAGFGMNQLRKTILGNISRDLNLMECRPPVKYVSIEQEENATKYSVIAKPSYADNPLVVGDRYKAQDMRLTWAVSLGRQSSGVCLMGINKGTGLVQKLLHGRHARAFYVKGTFGLGTDTHFTDGRIFEKATYQHITQNTLQRLLDGIQSAQQKYMYQTVGVPSQSQTTCEIGSQGLIRPAAKSAPLLYGIKCIHFNLPDFTLEIHCINEHEHYLKLLIHEIGLRLKSVAVCTQIRCIRYGFFTLEDGLLRKHWTLENILNNMTKCDELLQMNGVVPKSPTIEELSALRSSREMI